MHALLVTRARIVARGLVSAREGSNVPVTVEQKSLLKNLTPGCSSEEKHRLFDDPHLFDALKSFGVLPLSHAKCQALQDWLNEDVLCVSSHQLNVESFFNNLTNIINSVAVGERLELKLHYKDTYKIVFTQTENNEQAVKLAR